MVVLCVRYVVRTDTPTAPKTTLVELISEDAFAICLLLTTETARVCSGTPTTPRPRPRKINQICKLAPVVVTVRFVNPNIEAATIIAPTTLRIRGPTRLYIFPLTARPTAIARP